ncbi:MAG: hypothetical protein ACLTJG_18815 [[Clostridium] innocuum]
MYGLYGWDINDEKELNYYEKQSILHFYMRFSHDWWSLYREFTKLSGFDGRTALSLCTHLFR